MAIPVIAVAIAGAGLAITVIVLLVRGSFLLGGLARQVSNHDAKFDALDAKIGALDAKIDALTTAVHQTNAILVGLANHTHDADGRTVFTVPTGDRR